MVWFKNLVLGATILALCVVVFGAYVRLTDAGLGCPDWPGCSDGFNVVSTGNDGACKLYDSRMWKQIKQMDIDNPLIGARFWPQKMPSGEAPIFCWSIAGGIFFILNDKIQRVDADMLEKMIGLSYPVYCVVNGGCASTLLVCGGTTPSDCDSISCHSHNARKNSSFNNTCVQSESENKRLNPWLSFNFQLDELFQLDK